MGEVIIEVFECIKYWIFYFPVRTTSSHDVISIIVGNVDISYPAKMLLLTFFIGFPVLNKIHLKISVAFIQSFLLGEKVLDFFFMAYLLTITVLFQRSDLIAKHV